MTQEQRTYRTLMMALDRDAGMTRDHSGEFWREVERILRKAMADIKAEAKNYYMGEGVGK